jgi:hypothetical protein
MASPEGQNPNPHSFDLTDREKDTFDGVQKQLATGPDNVLQLLRDLRSERQLEFQIYASREQWFWIPWTVFLAGTLAAISSTSPLPGLIAPPLTAICAFALCRLRGPGLNESLAALNQRHKWTYWLTHKDLKNPCAQMFDFEFRVAGENCDSRHMIGFSYPDKMPGFTIRVWSVLWFLGIVRFWIVGESYPLKHLFGWA